MDHSTLKTYAESASQRANHLEARVALLEAEKRESEAAQLQKWKRQNEARTIREQQFMEELEKTKLVLEAERSMRNDLEASLQKLRGLCDTAKNRIMENAALRSKLEAELASAHAQIETLTNTVDETWLLNSHLTEEVEILRCELARAQFRQKQLEKGLERGQNVRALYVIADMFRLICERIELSPPDHSRTADSPQPANAGKSVADSLSSLITQAIEGIPKTPICLRDLSSLDHVGSLSHASDKDAAFQSSSASDALEGELLDAVASKHYAAMTPSATVSTCADFTSLPSSSTEIDIDGDITRSPRCSSWSGDPTLPPPATTVDQATTDGLETGGATGSKNIARQALADRHDEVIVDKSIRRISRFLKRGRKLHSPSVSSALPSSEAAACGASESSSATPNSTNMPATARERGAKKPRSTVNSNTVLIKGQKIKFPVPKPHVVRRGSLRRIHGAAGS